ncbi:hypothetical protein HK101_005175 [Irineochytrium annulatum]|nr:hypothetical protein HK101_005175 [Irineochytrium annulatum]
MNRPTSTLHFYSDLAQLDPALRLQATDSLIQILLQLQADHDAELDESHLESEDIEVRCPQDVSYGIQRLIRGLPSSRVAARQGFALALTELLASLEFLRVKAILDMLEHYTQATKSMSGQEERDVLFGRVFGLRAIVLSGMLERDHTTVEDLDRIVESLTGIASTKSYLREACFDLLNSVMASIASKGGALGKRIPGIVEKVLTDGLTSPEELWFVIHLQSLNFKKPKIHWEQHLEDWERPSSVLHMCHKVELANILKETSTTNPHLHSVWSTVFDSILLPSSPISLQDFWTFIVDEPLFTSTHDRKYVGFQLFQLILPRVSADQIPFLFSPNFMGCFINSLSNRTTFLHKSATVLAKQIGMIMRTRKDLSLPVVLQLIGKHGSQIFDKVTKTKTVETILGTLSADGVETYVHHLMEVFLDQASVTTETDDSHVVDLHRQWAVDQMQLLVRNSRIPKAESWVTTVTRFLLFHSLYSVQKAADLASVGKGLRNPSPQLSASIRTYCGERLQAILAELIATSLPKDAGASEQPAEVNGAAKHHRKTVLPRGTMPSGELWSHDLVLCMKQLEKSVKKGQLALSGVGGSEIEKVREVTKADIAAVRESESLASLSKKEPVNSELTSQYKAFETLLEHVLIQSYFDTSESLEVLTDLHSCLEQYFQSKPKPSSKKRPHDHDEHEGDGSDEVKDPVDVIVDILLGFLAKPSSCMRNVAEAVFPAFCVRLTKTSLDLILDVLTARSGIAGASDLFEDDDDEVEMEVLGSDAEDEDVEDGGHRHGAVNGNGALANGHGYDDEAGSEDDDAERDGDDAGESDDDEDEDDEEDDEGDDEDNEGEVDEAFKNKVREALGRYAMDEAAGSDDEEMDDLESVGDEEMEEFDNKLAEIFKERKKLKVGKKDAKVNVLNFKLHTVNLLDIFVRTQPNSGLIVKMIKPLLEVLSATQRSDDARDLHAKLTALLKHRVVKVKSLTITDPAEGLELLEEIHVLLRRPRATTADILALYSGVSVLLIKSLAKVAPHLLEGTPSETLERKGKKAKKSRQPDAAHCEPSPVAKIYAKTLNEFLTRKKSHVKPALFVDLATRQTHLALQLLPTLTELCTLGATKHAHQFVQGCSLVARLLQRLPAKEDEQFKKEIKQTIEVFAARIEELFKTVSGSAETVNGLNPDKMREVLKQVVAIAKRTKVAFEGNEYQSGFGNEFATEALEGALPEGQNSPQRCPYGLYAEQLSGTAFTAPRDHNQRSWLYRIRPSVSHQPHIPCKADAVPQNLSTEFSVNGADAKFVRDPVQMRWSPFPCPEGSLKRTFIEGLSTVAGAGDTSLRTGLAIHVYGANANMESCAFYNADGDYLIVPQQGRLEIKTELGLLHVEPLEIVVIPRGIRFAVFLPDGPSRGYVLETFDRHWELPDLGPIGSNGLANARDFLYPVASYEDVDIPFTIMCKYQSTFFSFSQDHSPFDVVAWHGNYAPFKYDLRKFNTINTVSYDHPDPSIFTVLTVKTANPGVALADFVIFPPRWLVAENTFRPPYFHRNCMSEFMGLISGAYDAKAEGFLPGGASLHSVMSAHGPDVATFEKASAAELKPMKTPPDGLAFMFETSMMMYVSKWAANANSGRQMSYSACWKGMPKLFNPSKK